MSNQNQNYNIEDTGALMTSAKGKSRTVRVVLIVIAIILVAAISLIGAKKIGDKRYNDQIEIADKAFIEGDYVTAEVGYLKAVEMNKRKPKAREGLAYTYAIQSKTEKSVKLYEELFADTKDDKYQKAAQDVSEGRLPIDSTLSPAQGEWRNIGVEDIPYSDDLKDFIYSLIWNIEYTRAFNKADIEFNSDNPSDFLPIRLIMKGSFANYEMSIEDRNSMPDGEENAAVITTSESDEPDPRNWMGEYKANDGLFYDYSVGNADQIDEVIRNIFNISHEYIETALKTDEENKTLYKEKDKYYMFFWNTGAVDIDVNYFGAWTDGEKYILQIEKISEDYDDKPNQTYFMCLKAKLIDGKHYWSVYSISKDMPEEILNVSYSDDEELEELSYDDGQVLVDEYYMDAINASVNNSGSEIPKEDFLYDFLMRYEQYNAGDYNAVAPGSGDTYIMLRLGADGMINENVYNVQGYKQGMSGSDPRGWNKTSPGSITGDSYYRADKSKLDWLASNIFNMTSEGIDSAIKSQEEKLTMYEEGGYYYGITYRTGLGPPPSIEIVKCKREGNTYEFNYNVDWNYMGNSGESDMRYSKMEIKNINGIWYWTIHAYDEHVSPELNTAI